MDLMPDELRRRLPRPGAAEGKDLLDLVVQARYYDPTSAWRWYVLEYDGEDEFFGLVVARHAALGSFTLSELRSLRCPTEEGGEVGVELDGGFEPIPLRELARREEAVAGLFEKREEGLISL